MRLSVTPEQWSGWAVYGIQYFHLRCTWSDHRPDQHCARAGYPHWSTDYGWFERIPQGFARTRMQVAPVGHRPKATRGQVVLWSSDFNTDSDASGTVRVRYAGRTLRIPVTAWQATNSGSHPLPKGYLQDQPSNPQVNNLADVGPITAWGEENNIDDPVYQRRKIAEAEQISTRLARYIRRWHRGKASPYIPASLFAVGPDSDASCCMSGQTLQWKLVRPKDFDPYAFWGSRVQQPNYDPQRDGITTLFPDINTTYIRADYPAPFGSKLVLHGKFPRSRFFDIQDSAPFDPQHPSGPSVGAPEVPIVDADIRPDRCSVNPFRVFDASRGRPHGCSDASGSPCVRFRDGEREVPNRCRDYTIVYRHALGDYIKLNDAVNPGLANETDRSPLRAPNGRNVRIGAGIRDGGGVTLGKLLPAQIWIRYYLPDRRAGVYGGVPLPQAYFQLKSGEKYVIEPVRGPDPRGTAHDQFLRRLNGPYPASAFKPQRTYEPQTTGWTADVGWHKVFGIARAIYEDVAIGGLGPFPFAASLTAPFTREYIREIDRRAYGRGDDKPGIGGWEQSATTCDYCHYMGRHIVIGSGSVAVLTAKLPLTPKTYRGEGRMTGGELRYFSISHYVNGPNQDDILNLVLPAGDFGSLSDEDLITRKSGPAKGWYVLVYSRQRDRPRNATAANGVTWQDWSDHTEQTMTLRWLEVGPEWSSPWAPNFRHMPFKTADWAAPGWNKNLTFNNDRTRSYMGDHQIEIHYMTKAQFEALGEHIDPMNIPHRDDWTGPLSPNGGVGGLSPPSTP